MISSIHFWIVLLLYDLGEDVLPKPKILESLGGPMAISKSAFGDTCPRTKFDFSVGCLVKEAHQVATWRSKAPEGTPDDQMQQK